MHQIDSEEIRLCTTVDHRLLLPSVTSERYGKSRPTLASREHALISFTNIVKAFATLWLRRRDVTVNASRAPAERTVSIGTRERVVRKGRAFPCGRSCWPLYGCP